MPKVQLFAFEIDTHNQDRINGILQGRGVDPLEMTQEQYFHQQASLQRDLIVAQVLPLVEDGTLPVFMAPEFYFKWNDGLPYERVTFFNVMTYLESLSASFPQVLWVLGTVWWQEPQDAVTQRVHNSALILQGGRLLHSWQKMRLSRIDGLRHGPEEWDRSDPQSARTLDLSQDPFFTAAVPGGGHLSCGVEVCLDHLTLADPVRPGVLRTCYLKDHPTPTSGDGLDLHIMVAAGMQMQPENITSRRGGAYLRCDGGAGANPRSQAVAVARPGGTAAEALRQWSPTCIEAAVQQRVGHSPSNRLAIYQPIAIIPPEA